VAYFLGHPVEIVMTYRRHAWQREHNISGVCCKDYTTWTL